MIGVSRELGLFAGAPIKRNWETTEIRLRLEAWPLLADADKSRAMPGHNHIRAQMEFPVRTTVCLLLGRAGGTWTPSIAGSSGVFTRWWIFPTIRCSKRRPDLRRGLSGATGHPRFQFLDVTRSDRLTNCPPNCPPRVVFLVFKSKFYTKTFPL